MKWSALTSIALKRAIYYDAVVPHDDRHDYIQFCLEQATQLGAAGDFERAGYYQREVTNSLLFRLIDEVAALSKQCAIDA